MFTFFMMQFAKIENFEEWLAAVALESVVELIVVIRLVIAYRTGM